MTRSELIEEVADAKDISPVVAEQVVLTLFETMKEALLNGNRIEIRGFGSFEIREYKERSTARNPRSGEPIKIGSRKSPFFKTGKELRDRLLVPVTQLGAITH